MPRRPRVYIPDQPQHVVVRGHNRDPILARPDDFRFLYKCLLDAADHHGLAVHTWVFMHNHIHLLVTPDNRQALPKTMQSVGRRYAQYFNRNYHRSGSLWEGRYKAALVDTESYLLSCYRYIELNPLRAGIVRQPEDYPYSSYPFNALGKSDSLVTPHAVYLRFIGEGSEPQLPALPLKREKYIALLRQNLPRKDITEIRRGTEKGLGIGQADFLLKVSRLAGGC